MGESIRVERVYRACVVSIYHKDTIIDLIDLYMTDFDLIFGIDWLHAYYASVDCRVRTIKFQFLNELVLEWKGDSIAPKGKFIFYLRASKMIDKGCIYHLVRLNLMTLSLLLLSQYRLLMSFEKYFLRIWPKSLLGD